MARLLFVSRHAGPVVRPWLVVVFVLACFVAFSARAAMPSGPGWELVPDGEVVNRAAADGEMWQASMWGRYTCTDEMMVIPQPFGVGEGIDGFPAYCECYDPGTDSMVADPGQEVYVRRLYVSATPPGESAAVEGLTAAEVVDLSWQVILCWAGAFTFRVLVMAARPTDAV